MEKEISNEARGIFKSFPLSRAAIKALRGKIYVSGPHCNCFLSEFRLRLFFLLISVTNQHFVIFIDLLPKNLISPLKLFIEI